MFEVLGESVFEEGGDFSSILTMTIANWEKVTVLETTKVRYRNPVILIYFIWVRRSQSCFSSKSELSYAISVHLSWISWKESKCSFFWFYSVWYFLIFLDSAISLLLLSLCFASCLEKVVIYLLNHIEVRFRSLMTFFALFSLTFTFFLIGLGVINVLFVLIYTFASVVDKVLITLKLGVVGGKSFFYVGFHSVKTLIFGIGRPGIRLISHDLPIQVHAHIELLFLITKKVF